MIKSFLSVLLAVGVATIPLTAKATDYYVSNSGNDSNNGTSTGTPFLTLAKAITTINTMSAGDNIYFNRGDEWDEAAATSNIGASCAAAWDSCVIGYYGTGAKPMIHQAVDNGTLFYLNGVDGWTIENLQIHCWTRGTDQTWPILSYLGGSSQGSHYIKVDSVDFTNCSHGFYSQGADVAGAGQNVNMMVSNNTFTDIAAAGVFGDGGHFSVDNNTFTRNGWADPTFDHSIYMNRGNNFRITNNTIGDSNQTSTGTFAVTSISKANPAVVVATGHGMSTGDELYFNDMQGMWEVNRHRYTATVTDANTFSLDGTDSTAYNTFTSGDIMPVAGRCHGVTIVMHGVIDEIYMAGNTLNGTATDGTEANAGCYLIAVDNGYGTEEQFTNITIEDNDFINAGGFGFGCASCGNVDIQFNRFTQDNSIYTPVALIGANDRAPDTYATNNVTVRFNSFTFLDDAGGTPVAIDISDSTDGLVYGNTITFGDTAGTCVISKSGSSTVYDNKCYNATGLTVNTSRVVE